MLLSADMPGRQALRSASTNRLDVPPPVKLHRQPILSGCRLADLELTARKRHFRHQLDAVVPAPSVSVLI